MALAKHISSVLDPRQEEHGCLSITHCAITTMWSNHVVCRACVLYNRVRLRLTAES